MYGNYEEYDDESSSEETKEQYGFDDEDLSSDSKMTESDFGEAGGQLIPVHHPGGYPARYEAGALASLPPTPPVPSHRADASGVCTWFAQEAGKLLSWTTSLHNALRVLEARTLHKAHEYSQQTFSTSSGAPMATRPAHHVCTAYLTEAHVYRLLRYTCCPETCAPAQGGVTKEQQERLGLDRKVFTQELADAVNADMDMRRLAQVIAWLEAEAFDQQEVRERLEDWSPVNDIQQGTCAHVYRKLDLHTGGDGQAAPPPAPHE